MADYGRPIEVGISIVPAAATLAEARALARQADAAGLDMIGIQDHPYQRRFLDPQALIAPSLTCSNTARASWAVRLSFGAFAGAGGALMNVGVIDAGMIQCRRFLTPGPSARGRAAHLSRGPRRSLSVPRSWMTANPRCPSWRQTSNPIPRFAPVISALPTIRYRASRDGSCA